MGRVGGVFLEPCSCGRGALAVAGIAPGARRWRPTGTCKCSLTSWSSPPAGLPYGCCTTWRQRTLAVIVVLERLPHPPTPCRRQRTLAANVAAQEAFPPTRPQRQSQAAGRVGGRDKFVARCAGGHGALAGASHSSCAEDTSCRLPLCNGLRLLEALVGRTFCLFVEACVVPKAPWPLQLHSRETAPPTRPQRKSQAAGRVGGRDMPLGRPTCCQGSWATTRSSLKRAGLRRGLTSQSPSTVKSVPLLHSLPYCCRMSCCQSTLAAAVALERNYPAHPPPE